MDFESVDLSTKPKSFTHYLMKIIPTLGKKTPNEIIDLIEGARDVGVNVSEDYLSKVIKRLEELRGNKTKLLKYLADIFLKGSELGVVTTSTELMEKLAYIYGSKDEVMINIVAHEIFKKSDLISNIRQTWQAASNDVEVFAERMKAFVNNYLSRNKSTTDKKALQKAIFNGTDNKAVLIYKDNEWVVVKAPSKVRV